MRGPRRHRRPSRTTTCRSSPISVDHPFALKAWADAEGYDFPLLSDFWPHGAVAQAYGVFNDDGGMALRGTFLVDTAGIVRFAEVNGPGEPATRTPGGRRGRSADRLALAGPPIGGRVAGA